MRVRVKKKTTYSVIGGGPTVKYSAKGRATRTANARRRRMRKKKR